MSAGCPHPTARLATVSPLASIPGKSNELAPEGAHANHILLRHIGPFAALLPLDEAEIKQGIEDVTGQNPFLSVVLRDHRLVQLIEDARQQDLRGQSAHGLPVARHGVESPKNYRHRLLDAAHISQVEVVM